MDVLGPMLRGSGMILFPKQNTKGKERRGALVLLRGSEENLPLWLRPSSLCPPDQPIILSHQERRERSHFFTSQGKMTRWVRVLYTRSVLEFFHVLWGLHRLPTRGPEQEGCCQNSRNRPFSQPSCLQESRSNFKDTQMGNSLSGTVSQRYQCPIYLQEKSPHVTSFKAPRILSPGTPNSSECKRPWALAKDHQQFFFILCHLFQLISHIHSDWQPICLSP